ncbi:restriction endonuclease subunit S [Crenobacter caeni]|uniref:Restriction endonuclease subunit S n=1 Tax=Crenobacter caeni TaxID=2705474 RepID=A0A6B2KU86_9NEIS|nr:restriction endonuclease subunit S [Crenobacter caeni]NDV13805.1 restriction endonuclease subunit S [Crenobacter caeni]
MSFEWRRLGDHCLKIGSGATPKGGKDAYLDSGPFTLIRSQNVYNDGFKPAGLAFISTDQAKKLDGVSVEAGDVLLNITGDSVARVCLAHSQYLPARVNQHVAIVRPNPSVFDSRFLRYFLASPYQQDLMLGLAAAGATRNALTKGMIEDFKVPCPPIREQKASADVLSALDDRIALLRETNATLEAIAQALFKSWFVDFDPIHANAGTRPATLPPELQALFPSTFTETAQGLVPEGWEASVLGDICRRYGGLIQTGPFGSQLHASDYVAEGIPVVMPRDIVSRRVEQSTTAKIGKGDALRLAKHYLKNGDIVFSRRGDVEKHALIGGKESGWLCGTGCLLVRPGKGFPSSSFLSRSLDQAASREWLVRHAVGATMPNLNTSILEAVPVLQPSTAVLIAFEKLVGHFECSISHNIDQAQTLSTLRDTLLPRLISGQLRLSEAETLIEEAGA